MPQSDSKVKKATLSLVRTASIVKRAYEALMHEHDITLQQFNVLRILRGAGEPLPTMEVAARMIEPEPGITRLIGRLVDKGLVTRTRCGEDSRRVLCAISAKGQAVLKGLDEPVLALDDLIMGSMTEADLDEMIRLLNKACEEVLAT